MYPNKPGGDASPTKSAPPPPPFDQKQFPEGQWSTDLCDCCDDPSTCFMTCCCPCITMGQLVEIIDRGTTSCAVGSLIYYGLSSVCCGWVYACTYRSKLRGLFSLPEAPFADCLVHACCCVCSLSQEYRELNNRGVDPSIGWLGNVEKWKREGITVPPIAVRDMAR